MRKFPYAGCDAGIADFGDSLTVQSELANTKIENILKRFQVTGVLPSVGRVALPADQFFGGEDFDSLAAKLSDAKACGIDEATLMSEEGNESGSNSPASAEGALASDEEGKTE